MNYKYVFFDFNGTILDDVELCLNLLNEMLLLDNEKPINLEKYKNIFTFPIIEYYKKAGFTFKNHTFEELSHYFIERYQPMSFNCKLNPHILELLNFLRKRNCRIILLSASQIDNLKEQLIHFKIEKYFDYVLGTSDIYAKSKMEIAKQFFKLNNINHQDVLFIGDTLHDYEIANSLNCACALVDFGHQSQALFKNTNAKIISSFLQIWDLYD